MKMKKAALLCLLILGISLCLTGCIPGDGSIGPDNPAGFFWGIWHGWVAPVSLVLSLTTAFQGNVGIYEVYNTGFLYDLGFYMAIISGFGGLALVRKKHRD